MKKGYIYILTNTNNTVLYTGVTNSLKRRMLEHSEGRGSLFASRYGCSKLVYYEVLPSIDEAIIREKQIKHYKRAWKDRIITEFNPQWNDLASSLLLDPDFV